MKNCLGLSGSNNVEIGRGSMQLNLLAGIASFLIFSCFFLPGCKNDNPNIFGTYKIYSDDPAVRLFIEGQDTYIKLNDDQTIVYNSTINGKPKFHNEGTFTLDKNNEITIQWKTGKLPGKLRIEMGKDDYMIRIGSTIYKKEKKSS